MMNVHRKSLARHVGRENFLGKGYFFPTSMQSTENFNCFFFLTFTT